MSISNLFQDNVYKIFSSEIDTSSYKYKGNAFFKTTDTISVPYTSETHDAGNVDIICSFVGKTITVFMNQTKFTQVGGAVGPSFTIQLPDGYRPSLAQAGLFYSTTHDGADPPANFTYYVGSYHVPANTGLITFIPNDEGDSTDADGLVRDTPAQCITLIHSA